MNCEYCGSETEQLSSGESLCKNKKCLKVNAQLNNSGQHQTPEKEKKWKKKQE
jgi:hypothetical protein